MAATIADDDFATATDADDGHVIYVTGLSRIMCGLNSSLTDGSLFFRTASDDGGLSFVYRRDQHSRSPIGHFTILINPFYTGKCFLSSLICIANWC